jgi:hypothetical protein
VRIERFDPAVASDDEWRAYCANAVPARSGIQPVGFPEPEPYLRNTISNKARSHVEHVFAAWSGDEVVGSAEVEWWEAEDNKHLAWMHFTVLPSRADEALFAALLGPLLDVTRAAGRTSVTAEVQPGSAALAYVESVGAQRRSREQHNVAPVGAVPREALAAIVADVPDGYERWGFDGRCPDAMIEPYAALVHTMNTAPRDDLPMEDVVFSPARLREWEDSVAARGHQMWTVGARSVATGELAAFTQLIVMPDWPEVAEQEDTAVAIPHRGHGLGLWVKAMNLLRVMDERPSVQRVSTWNAVSNDHMIRVNRELGFACEHEWETWELPA